MPTHEVPELDGSTRNPTHKSDLGVATSPVTDPSTAQPKRVDILRQYQSILFDQVHDAVIVTDLDGIITFWNDGATRTLGWTADEMVGQPIFSRIPMQDRAGAQAIFDRVQGGESFDGRYRDTTKSGDTVWLDTRLRRIHDETGQCFGIMGASRNVTAEKQQEDQLRLTQAIVRHARDNILVTEADYSLELGGHRIIYANPSIFDNTGYTPEELIGKTPKIFQGPKSDREVLNRISDRLKAWKPVREEVLNYRKDGREYWVELDISPLADETGWYTHWISIQRNVTERRRAEEAQRKSEDKYQDLVESIDVMIWELDPKTMRLTFVSRRVETLLGNSQQVWLSTPDLWLKHVHHDDVERVLAHFQSMTADGQARILEYRMFNTDGKMLWVRDRAKLVARADEPTRLVGYTQDITEQKLAEISVAEVNERYRLLADNATDLISLLDTNGNVVFNSPSVTRLTGYTAEERVGQSSKLIVHPDDLSRIVESQAACFRGEMVQIEWRLQCKSGQYIWVETNGQPMFEADGSVKYILSCTRDIHQRKELEQHVRQTQKLEAIGQLAGGIAHDFNNLLTVVNGNTELLMMKLSPDDPHREMLANILRAGERGAGLTRQLLTFSRHQMFHQEVFDPVAVVRGTLAMLERLLGEDVRITPSYADEVGYIRSDISQFEQVLVNLAVNARDAMPQGGRLGVILSEVRVTEAESFQNPTRLPGLYVRLSVSDTGTGMTPEVKARLFEPFFTTKPQGKGTGLGLATVYGIVRLARGFIVLDSELGRGTTFHIHFPRQEIQQQPELAPPQNKVISKLTTGGIIVVVEDDDAVRCLTATVLENAGYTVILAATGEEALAQCADLTSEPDLVITDVVMPGMNGNELVKKLAELYPNLKVAFLSGYTADTVERYGVEDRLVAYLQKPYTPDSLSRFVRDVLGEAKT